MLLRMPLREKPIKASIRLKKASLRPHLRSVIGEIAFSAFHTAGLSRKTNEEMCNGMCQLWWPETGIEPPAPAFSGPPADLANWSGISGSSWKKRA